MTNKSNKIWIWGYVMSKVPEKMAFVPDLTYCSLETAANYMCADNVVFMNSTHNLEDLNEDLFKYVADRKQVLCGLTHGKYAEAAREVSLFSKSHPNIVGAIIDDFLDSVGPSAKMTVEELAEVSNALKSENPSLKLYVVRYSRQEIHEIDPYLEYIDGINFWVWVSTEHYWRYQYPIDILKLQEIGKPVLQGVFMHNYGEGWIPQDINMLKLQIPSIFSFLRTGKLEGCVILQNGWFCREDHREQVQWLKNYLDWYLGTITVRD